MTDAGCDILIVDDEPANLLALEAILEPLGQSLVRAATGKEALRHALHREFAVVLLDVQMPGMDGFECAELLRSRGRTRDLPIIFLTAISKDDKFIQRGYGVGAVDYLFKPYEPDVLRSKVTVFVELAKKNAIIRAQAEALRQAGERELADYKRWSEKRYADLADAMPQMVWTASTAGKLAYTNAQFRALGEGFAAVVHPDDLDRFYVGWQDAVSKGVPWEAELRFGGGSGGFRFHLVRVVPRKSSDGTVLDWVGSSTDIDERVRAERAVRLIADASRLLAAAFEEPSHMQAVVEVAVPALGDAVILEVDGQEKRRFSAMMRSPSFRGQSDAGKTPLDLDDPRLAFGPTHVRQSQAAELRVGDSGLLAELGISAYLCLPLSSRGRIVGTMTFIRKSGAYSDDEILLATDLAARIAVSIDNVRLHETTEKRRVELERANRSKDVFLATLSHELRTPLNAIVGWTDMMRNGQLAETEHAHALETIDRNAHALSGLVADLLDVSRIVTGALKIDSKLVPIGEIVASAVESARPQYAAQGITLEVSAPAIGCVLGDAGRLRQVLGNLLSNARKFTPSGGTVEVHVGVEGGLARIAVTDSGEGIEPDLLPHVFERFKQAEKAKPRGLGLGLAIVKHLVDAHGGTVTATSAGPRRGARFVVDLPLAAEVTDADAPSRPPQAQEGTPDLGGIRALVVEDDPDGNELITTILERYGATVRSVGTAADAIEALDVEVPDILVSDIGLPDADGMDLVRLVRAREDCAGLPAIALTAYASRQDAAKAIAAGFDAHVAKPVQPRTLGATVARLVAARPRLNSQPAA